MNNLVPVIDLTKRKFIRVITLADIHVGAESFDEKAFLDITKYIHDQSKHSNPVYWCGIGDFFENVTASCVADPYSQNMLPHDQVEYLYDKLKLIKDRGLFMVSGNHEARTRKRAYYDMMIGLSDRLGVKYLGMGGYVKLLVGNQTYVVALQHGARCTINYMAELERMLLNYPEAELLLMGHDHGLHFETIPHFVIDKFNKEVQSAKYFGRCGNFLGYANYARENSYRQKITGCLNIRLDGEKHSITGFKMQYLNGERIEA